MELPSLNKDIVSYSFLNRFLLIQLSNKAGTSLQLPILFKMLFRFNLGKWFLENILVGGQRGIQQTASTRHGGNSVEFLNFYYAI